MPSNTSANCCMGRNPPSPEGPAPRLAISPPTPNRNLSASRDPRAPIPSWGTSLSAQCGVELRAIFEDDKSEDESPELKAKVTPRLKALLGGDKPYSADDPKAKVRKSRTAKLRALLEGDPEHQRVKPKESSSTLSVVKNKLKKALPGGLVISKRHSRSSVGTSEEIERRAELRRIRQKRIQDELSNEGIYDEDAKSLSTVEGADSSLGNKNRNPWVSGDFLPLPELTPLALPLPSFPFPKLPLPHDQNDAFQQEGIYELRSAEPSPRPRSESEIMIFIDSPTLVNSSPTISRRHSSPILSEFEITAASEIQVYRPSRKRSSIPPIPPAPILRPKRLSSIVEPTKSSWRLSFSSDNRGEHLRKLSQGAAIPISLITQQQQGVVLAPINRWLRSQGLRSTSQAIASTEDSTNLESSASHSHTCSACQDFGGVDGVEDGSTAIHLHEMGISQRLASKGLQSSSSSPQLSSWGGRSHHREVSSVSGASRLTDNGRARYLRNTSDSIPLSERIPPTWGKILKDDTSSFYPSCRNSIQPSRESSRFNLLSLLAGGKDKVDVVLEKGLEETEAVNAIHHIPRFPTANCSTASLPLPLGRYTRRTTIDNSSILVSETESFQEREVELSMVKKRFATTEAYRSPNTPRSSKFREEFDFQSSALEADTPTKPSALVRLARLASRSYDGTTGMEEMLGVPLLDVTPGALRHADTGLSPLGDDSVSNIWGKAVKRAADNRSKGAAGNLYTPDKKLRQDDSSRKKSQISQDSRAKGAFQFPRTLSWGKRGKQKSAGVDEMDAHEKAAAEYQQRFQERMAAKEMVMDSWEAELAATAKRAQAKSRNIIHKIKPTGPDRRYPASWSRFPCHSRSDRSFTASTSEGVEQRDFAIKEILDNGEPVWFHNEHKYHLYHHDDDEHPSHEEAGPTILGKLQAKLGEKLQELELFEDQAFSDRTGGRRSSMNLAGTLEYPELEILAVTEGTITQKQLENQVDREIRGDVGGQRMKMTKKAALEGSVDLDSEDEEEKLQELEMSIADPRFYDDCIANPALEGNNVDGADSDGDGVEEMQPKSSKKEKFRTWSSRDWDGYKYGSNGGGRNVSLGIVALRHSTDEFRCEIERMEKVEREKVLRAAEDAWGVRCG